jgi:signal transduction histidine kinase
VAKRETVIISAYVAALAVFALVAVFVFIQFERYDDRMRRVQHTLHVITTVDDALGQLKDLETGQRGYLIAGDDDFLEPYERGVQLVHARLRKAKELVADNPAQLSRLRELEPLVDQKIAFSKETVDVFAAGERARAHELVAARHGKTLMDEIRARVLEIQEEERRLLLIRNEQARAMNWRTTSLLVFGNGFAFGLLALGTVVLGRELNRRKRLEEQSSLRQEQLLLRTDARRAERRLQAVLDETPFPVMIADAQAGARGLRNKRLRELAGDAPLVLLRADGTQYAAGSDPVSRALRQGAVVRGEEVSVERPDGSSTAMLADAAPVREDDGRILGAVTVLHDLAEVRRAEERRVEGQRFNEVFLGALGHEMRNPLSVITAGTASLARRASGAAELKLVHRMGSSAQRMSRMIDQLLDLVQARLGGGIPIERQRMDLADLVRSVVAEIEVAHPEHTLTLESSGELVGAWDRERLSGVVRALVENALEHGRPDTPVHISVRSSRDSVSLNVCNEGNPIPDDLLPLIFDPFRRAAERKRMKSSGLGIGLFLALHVVRAHGGTIDVTSSAEHGTVFRATIPRGI